MSLSLSCDVCSQEAYTGEFTYTAKDVNLRAAVVLVRMGNLGPAFLPRRVAHLCAEHLAHAMRDWADALDGGGEQIAAAAEQFLAEQGDE